MLLLEVGVRATVGAGGEAGAGGGAGEGVRRRLALVSSLNVV